jgi:hypothetical protein
VAVEATQLQGMPQRCKRTTLPGASLWPCRVDAWPQRPPSVDHHRRTIRKHSIKPLDSTNHAGVAFLFLCRTYRIKLAFAIGLAATGNPPHQVLALCCAAGALLCNTRCSMAPVLTLLSHAACTQLPRQLRCLPHAALSPYTSHPILTHQSGPQTATYAYPHAPCRPATPFRHS